MDPESRQGHNACSQNESQWKLTNAWQLVANHVNFSRHHSDLPHSVHGPAPPSLNPPIY